MQESTAVADTAQIKAIRMPELILVIGSHLNYLDLTRCIRVCRAWHLLLEPLLWRAFEYPTSAPRLRLGKHGASRTQPTLDQFRAMAHRIQRFICHREPPPHYIPTLIPTCRQLDQLHVFFTTPEVDDLLLQNKGTLRSLAVVSNMYRPDIAHLARQVLTDRVLQMDRLEELALFRFQVPVGAQGEAFLEICRRLWALELGRCKVDIVFPGQPSTTGEEGACGTGGQRGDNDNDNGAFTLPGLRRLKLDRNLMSTRNELALWKACTHLEDLTWVLTESTRIPDNVVDTTRVFPISEVCEHLSIPSSLSMAQSLVRLDIHLAQLSDEEFARLLGLLPRLQILIADDTAFGLNALAVLLGDDSSHTNNASNDSIDNNTIGSRRRRAHQWRELSFLSCRNLTGLEIQEILTSCSSLKVFRGDSIYICQTTSPESLVTTDSSSSSSDTPTPPTTTSTAISRTGDRQQQESVLKSRPWVCSGLEELYLRIVLCTEEEAVPLVGTVPDRGPETMRVRSGLVYDRLAGLTRLRLLSLSDPFPGWRGQDYKMFGLDLSLEYGLARLAPLKRLQQLELYCLENELRIGDQEFRWMEDHLPRLEAVVERGWVTKGLGQGLGPYRFYIGKG